MTPALGVYGLSYSVSSAAILREVSFEVAKGQIVALLGPNGSGKTTLLKAIAGLLRRSAHGGIVRVQGADFLSQAPRNRARQLAYVGADLRHDFPLTVEEAILMGRHAHDGAIGSLRLAAPEDWEAVTQAMDRCLCRAWADRTLASLSSGERQLVTLARALAQGAKILLLDETLSRMDLHHQAAMGRLLRELSRKDYTIVLVSHDLNLASEWADQCILLRRGEKIAQGATSAMITEEKIRGLYPDAPLVVGKNPASGAPKIFFGA